MGPIFRLSLRQLLGKSRIAVIVLLAAAPVAMVAAIRAFNADMQAEDLDELAVGIVGVLMVAAVLPIVTMTLATASFGNEVEDRTLGYIVLNPVSRWSIVLSKLLAPVIIAGPVLAVSGMLVAGVWLDGDGRTVAAVGVGMLAGVAAYSAIFTWLGLTTGHPLGFALVYVFIWEGVLSTLLSGTRYLSVRAYTMTLMEGIDTSRLGLFEEQTIEMQAAIGGVIVVTVLFFWLTVRRLRTMDVP